MAGLLFVRQKAVMSSNSNFYIYGSMAERDDRTQCTSMHDVMAKFKEVVRVYRQRGNQVTEADDSKWLIANPKGKTDAIWIEDSEGKVVKALGV